MLSDIDRKLETAQLERLYAILKIQSSTLNEINNYFNELDFLQIMPVILAPSTDPITDGGKSELVPGSIKYSNMELKLTQSMILHKQVAVGQGFDKIYILSPNVRLEDKEMYYSGNHLIEFTQVDFEMAETSMSEVFQIVEKLLHRIKKSIEDSLQPELKVLQIKYSDWPERLPRYSTHEMEHKYGEDWMHLASKDHSSPFWVTCHNRHFYEAKDPDQQGNHYLNFTLYYPEGYGEALSGSQREIDFIKLVDRMEELGLSRYDYSSYLLKAQSGLLRHSAGAGFGVERLVRFLTGVNHIGEIQLFRRVPGEEFEL